MVVLNHSTKIPQGPHKSQSGGGKPQIKMRIKHYADDTTVKLKPSIHFVEKSKKQVKKKQ